MTSKNEKKKFKMKVWFMDNIKLPMEAGMLCTIDGETFHLLTKNTLTKSLKYRSWFKEALAVCLPSKKESFASMSDNLKY